MAQAAAAQAHHVPFSRPTTPAQHAPQIGFYGLGSMGIEMARNLIAHPYAHPAGKLPPLVVYNRTRAKCDALLKEVGQDKVVVAKDIEQLVQTCDVIITSFATDEVVKAAYEQFHAVLQASKTPLPRLKIFVETSTIYPALAGELDRMMVQTPHVHFITSPVFGPPAGAKARSLLIVMSGDYRSKKDVAYLLVPSVGRKVIDLGGNVEKAPTMKLIGNSFILGQIELMAETMTLAEKTAVGADNVFNFIKELMPGAGPLHTYAPKLLNDQFDGKKGFAIDGGIKDARHVTRLAAEHNSPMPITDITLQHMLTARAIHQGQVTRGRAAFEVLDWSALIAGTRLAAGLDAFDSSKHTPRVVKDD